MTLLFSEVHLLGNHAVIPPIDKSSINKYNRSDEKPVNEFNGIEINEVETPKSFVIAQ
jgi:hypothetical protein